MRLGLIAGNRNYPLIFAQEAKKQAGVYLTAVAFNGETKRQLAGYVDHISWLEVGHLQRMIDVFKQQDVKEAVMIGQITPSRLFKKLQADARMQKILTGLVELNAETIFTAVAKELEKEGVYLKDARLFLDKLLVPPGLLTAGELSEAEKRNIDFGYNLAKYLAARDIGQSIVVKSGTVVAVEAIEGTDAMIRRGGRIARGNVIVVKVSKPGQDMRFDIPIIGPRTICVLFRSGGGVLAAEAGRVLILEKDKTIKLAERYNVKVVGI